MGYVLSEIKLIEDLVEENALKHNLDEWDVTNLRLRIAMILKDNEKTNRVIKVGTANAQSLIAQGGSIEPVVTGFGEAYDELSYVITELRLIKELVGENPTNDEAWNTSDLRTQIELILTERRENVKDAMILKSMKEHLTVVMDRLGGEMAKLEADEFQGLGWGRGEDSQQGSR
jgi:hypothetical protein